MKTTSLLHALAACALVAIAARPAMAQSTANATTQPAAASTPWAANPTGTYHLDIQLPDHVMPATLTIADSSGVPTARMLPEGDNDALPMRVTIKGAELFLNGDTPKGPAEIVLLRDKDQLSGRWSYAGDDGKLTGKVEK
jgi:hypothetical protein